jgi:hypothetical protein
MSGNKEDEDVFAISNIYTYSVIVIIIPRKQSIFIWLEHYIHTVDSQILYAEQNMRAG